VSAGPVRGGPQEIPRPFDHAPGRPAPWAERPSADLEPDLATVRARVEAFGPPLRNDDLRGARSSAVLAACYEGPEGPTIVLTRRAQHLRSHRGEVSFPGGRQEPDETLTEAALREACEEVGLARQGLEVVGELDHLSTFSSRSAIAPFVAVVDHVPELTPAPAEVDRILRVPLAELLLPEVFREERWRLPSADRPIYFFELVGDTIWGATARMLRQLLAVVTGSDARDTEDAW
jgi:8-oxo-dGTP pyrophosphatase MutT (NUDIX family)